MYYYGFNEEGVCKVLSEHEFEPPLGYNVIKNESFYEMSQVHLIDGVFKIIPLENVIDSESNDVEELIEVDEKQLIMMNALAELSELIMSVQEESEEQL